MNKEFDCVEMKRKIHEQWWVEAGENLDNLKKLLSEKIQNNDYIKEYFLKKEAQLKTAGN